MAGAVSAAGLRLLCLLLLAIFALVPPSCSLSTHAPRPSVDDSRSAITFLSPPSVPTPAGLLFVATLDGQLHALDLQSGLHQWSFGTGESLLRSTPATSVTSAPQPAPPLATFDPFAVMDGEADDGEEDESESGGAEADHVIIPGVDGQLFFSTRQGQLERLPVTVSDLVTASPFRSSDERMYVGRKSSAFIQLNRTTGEVKRVLNEYGEQLHRGPAEGEDDDSQQQLLDEDSADLLWVDRQDLSIHAFHSRHGRRWNVSLSEYFVHIGGAEKAAWSEERLVSIGIPHLAATVDGELVAINVADRERYQWRHAFASPISSVHFSRSAASPASPASLLDSLLPPHQLLKLPVYYLPPVPAGGGSASLVSQYLWVRMKALRTKTVDTYVGQTAEGVLYALPNPPSSGSEVLPVEEDNLLIYQPPAEPSSSNGLVPVSSSSARPSCSASHPFYPLCMVGFHSVPEADPVRDGQYLPLPWHPVPAVRNISRESEHQPYTAGKDAMETGGGTAEGATGWAGSWWASVVTSAVVSACMSAPLLIAMWLMHVKNNSSRKRRRRDRQADAAPGSEDRMNGEEKQDRSWAKGEMKHEEKEDADDSERGDSDDEEKQGVKAEDEEEKKEIVVKPPSQPTFLLPATAAARHLSTSSSSSSSSSASSPSLPSPTNSDGSLAIPPPSTGLSSVLSSMSQVYSIGKIQIFADQVLGTGNQGTIVYAGLHETRECAVKRLVKPFFGHENADKEIGLLIQSDQHSCVLRYYAKEEDASFIYIALEKCAGSLQDLVREPQRFPGAEPLRVLHDMLLGLAHLHAINIVHRDIKPQNILLSLHRAVYRSKLADMGLGKKLDHARSSFANSVFSRSEGWQPPEVLMVAGGAGAAGDSSASPTGAGARLTKAVDVFSAGCVVYYVLTGHHPFGVLREQEMNIVAGRASYSHLSQHRAEAEELISSMLSPLPDDRLSANDCCHHPLFWSDEQKLHFLLDVSDRVEAEPEHSECRLTLERFASAVFPSSAPWDGLLHRGLLDSLHKFRKYDFCSVRDLLRVIRNKRHHYRDLPEEVQRELGPMPSGFLHYFASRFPALLMACYRVMSCFCLEREGEEGGGSVSGWEEVEAEERRGAGRSAIPLSAPLTEWPGVVLTTQLRLYYQHCSMKRLLQLQDAARLRYRVWSNEEEAWVQDSCNLNAECRRDRGGVRLVRGWSEHRSRDGQRRASGE